MFIIDLNYIVPLEEIDNHMATHVEYLEKYYKKNVFVSWGRKEASTVCVILALAGDKVEVEKIITEDPFYIHGLAEIKVTESIISKCHPDLRKLVD